MRLTLLSTFFLVVLGCGDESKDESVRVGADLNVLPGGGKLSSEDLARPLETSSLTRADVISHMESRRAHFLALEVDTILGTMGSAEYSCADAAISELTATASGESLSADFVVDISLCSKAYWEKKLPATKVTLSKAQLSFYLQQSCQGGDLSALHGQKLSSIETIPECDKNLSLKNIKVEIAGLAEGSTKTTDLSSTLVFARSTVSNEACAVLREGSTYTEDPGCVTIWKKISSADGGTAIFSQSLHKSLKSMASNKNSWYASGSLEISLNDWAGTVSYRGSEINPAYTMKYGSEIINGTLTVP